MIWVAAQLLALSIFIFGLACVGVFYPYNRGGLFTALIVLYALTAGIAGYTAGSYYKQMDGCAWVRNILLTSVTFCGPLFLVFCINNTVAISYRVSQISLAVYSADNRGHSIGRPLLHRPRSSASLFSLLSYDNSTMAISCWVSQPSLPQQLSQNAALSVDFKLPALQASACSYLSWGSQQCCQTLLMCVLKGHAFDVCSLRRRSPSAPSSSSS